MSELAEKLKAQLAALSEEDRAALAHFLIQSLDKDTDASTEEAWIAELHRRAAEVERGEPVLISAAEAMQRLREKYS